LVELIEGGKAQRGDGEEEGEFGCRLAREAEQQAADDGGAGARSARDEGDGLGKAELDGIEQAQVLDVFHADDVLALLGPEDDESADDEGKRDRYRSEQIGLDGAAENQAEDGQRQK